MLCFVAIGYIYWLTATLMAFSSRTILGKVVVVCWCFSIYYWLYCVRITSCCSPSGCMFVGLLSIKYSYALINELWFSSFAKSLSRSECLVFPRLAARVSRFKTLKRWCYAVSAFESGNKSNSIMLYHLNVMCDILQVGVPDSSSSAFLIRSA